MFDMESLKYMTGLAKFTFYLLSHSKEAVSFPLNLALQSPILPVPLHLVHPTNS